ncbi:hypothetical protein AVEN_208845-1 [Araneus ventricosus]|uniref:Uncharacterized protein n=1 Tax=Araneus ventricosus TaxID=182803 RepID=A0A4Y2KSF9_ARAVE|nr:hypothetical protein AVEN_208845-1 [Araneus ventricosus]
MSINPSRLLSPLPIRGRGPKQKKNEHYAVFPVSDKNNKEKIIVVRIMAKNTRYERISSVAVAMMDRAKCNAKDYEILARWFKVRREKEEGCFTAGPKGQLINENQRKTLPRKTLLVN